MHRVSTRGKRAAAAAAASAAAAAAAAAAAGGSGGGKTGGLPTGGGGGPEGMRAVFAGIPPAAQSEPGMRHNSLPTGVVAAGAGVGGPAVAGVGAEVSRVGRAGSTVGHHHHHHHHHRGEMGVEMGGGGAGSKGVSIGVAGGIGEVGPDGAGRHGAGSRGVARDRDREKEREREYYWGRGEGRRRDEREWERGHARDGSPALSVASVPVRGGAAAGGGRGDWEGGLSVREDLGFGETRGPAKVRVKRGVRERTKGLFSGLRRDSNAGEMGFGGRRRMPILLSEGMGGGGSAAAMAGGAVGGVGGTPGVSGGAGGASAKSAGKKSRGGAGGALVVGAGKSDRGKKANLRKQEKALARRERRVGPIDRVELHRIDDRQYVSPWQATEQLAAEVRELRARIEEVQGRQQESMNRDFHDLRYPALPPASHALQSAPVSTSAYSPEHMQKPSPPTSPLPQAVLPTSSTTSTNTASTTTTSHHEQSSAAEPKGASLDASASPGKAGSVSTAEEREQKSSDGDLGRRNIDVEALRQRFEDESGEALKESVVRPQTSSTASLERELRQLRDLCEQQRLDLSTLTARRDELKAERDVLADRIRVLDARKADDDVLRLKVKHLTKENDKLKKQMEDKKLRFGKSRANVEVIVDSLKAELAASKARLHAEVAESERLRNRLSIYEGSAASQDLQLD